MRARTGDLDILCTVTHRTKHKKTWRDNKKQANQTTTSEANITNLTSLDQFHSASATV